MSKIIILFLSAVLLSAAGSCDAAFKDWSEKERKLYSSYIALQLIDTHQTFKMIDCQKHAYCQLHEMNPLLGPHPKKAEVLALKAIGNAGIFLLLDKYTNEREKTLKILNGTFTLVIVHNGIQLTKRF